jgi:hypothetical protein
MMLCCTTQQKLLLIHIFVKKIFIFFSIYLVTGSTELKSQPRSKQAFNLARKGKIISEDQNRRSDETRISNKNQECSQPQQWATSGPDSAT